MTDELTRIPVFQEYMNPMLKKGSNMKHLGMPAWTEHAGGRERWSRWARRKARDCVRRAKKWSVRTGRSSGLPTQAQWNDAIVHALHQCGGHGQYSRLLLSMDYLPTDPRYPSVDHVEGAAVARVAIELRVVNDMKTILDEREFKDIIGHLALKLDVPKRSVPNDWRCERDFAGPQKLEEPPLPGPKP